MSLSNPTVLILLGVFANTAAAITPTQMLIDYSTRAAQHADGFQASTARGQAFFVQRYSFSADFPSCATCHTKNPLQNGRHVVTDKQIGPLSPLTNPERFNDVTKVEKWFRRNCTEVVGRECTAGEKADLLAFLIKGN